MIIGYTAGVYDLFHIGHLNLLKNAKGLCDKLIVGVTVDELVLYKGKKAIIPFSDRLEIVRNIKYVDAVVAQYDMDKLTMCKKLGATILFVGDDWYDTPKWQDYEKEFNKAGIKIIYFPYTKGISSTQITKALNMVRSEQKGSVESSMKDFCCSSFLAFRYIEKDGMDFFPELKHRNFIPPTEKEKTLVSDENDVDNALSSVFKNLKNEKLGLMLSGGMDSACLASYMSGCDAYTFRFCNGEFQKEELKRAERFANYYNLKLHYVDINWNDVETYLPIVIEAKNAPVHSIEPQIYKAAIQAKNDGITKMIIGESSDLIFGGMDQLLSKDWDFDEFMHRYIFLEPAKVLRNPVDMSYLFERYRLADDKIDFLKFMNEVFSIESSSSYLNAFNAAGLAYVDPYAKLKMKDSLDLRRVRNGEPKYIIRALFHRKYPDLEIPNKTPMPRPVELYFKDWEGPKRKEFLDNIPIQELSGNQKWQIYCLEQFLNMYD